MRNVLLAITMALLVSGCQSPPGGVGNKVLQDWGLRERPEGYVSASDRVYEKLDAVGETEIRRMNARGRLGEVKYHEDGMRGRYYKEVKVYEKAYPMDARAVTGSTKRDEGSAYRGFIDYTYRVFQSERKPTRAEAQAETAKISTDITGRESYRYGFNTGGNWNGGKGEKVKR